MINEWKEILADCMDQHLAKIIISGPRKKDSVRKIEIRPVLLKEQLVFQASAYTEKQVQHYNLTEEEVYEKVAGWMEGFRQLEVLHPKKQVQVLVSKKGKRTVRQLKSGCPVPAAPLEHNRRKKYILDPDIPVPFLHDLGVQTKEGKQLAEDYGYEKLTFLTGDIADYDGVDHVDMVVTLHACDTATDYALDKAVRWGAKVILSVPCCQHEVNRQIENELLQPVLKYGLIKERMSALLTDAIRANLLEEAGYQVQVLEFIDMEHTPKNILLRAVKSGRQKRAEELTKMMEELHVSPTLAALMREERDAADA